MQPFEMQNDEIFWCRALGAGQDLKEFDCDHKLGLTALKRMFEDFAGTNSAMPGVKVRL